MEEPSLTAGRTRNRRSHGIGSKGIPGSDASRGNPPSGLSSLDFLESQQQPTQEDSHARVSGKAPASRQVMVSTTALGELNVADSHDDSWLLDSSDHHHISTGGINPILKRPACKKSGKKRRRSVETGKVVKRFRKFAPSISNNTETTCTVGILDEAPLRLVNPLIEFPEFPISAGPIDISRVPNGAELHAYTEIAFHRPDTYPLAYYARVLGFAVPDQPDGDEFVELDPDNVPLLSSHTPDPFFKIPPEGKFYALPVKPCNSIGDEDDQRTLDYVDPVYQYFLTHTEETIVPAQAPVAPAISTACIEFARRCGFISEEWTFQYWKPLPHDPGAMVKLTEWLGDKDLIEKLSTPASGHFLILAAQNSMPKAYIHYQFQWYQLETEVNIHKRPLSELIIRIHGIVHRGQSNAATPSVNVAETQNSSDNKDTEDADKGESEINDVLHSISPTSGEQGLLDTSTPHGNASVTLVLAALVLEHAHASNVWYALFDCPPSDVHAFELYLRMTRRPRRPDAVESDRVPLVCDLKKYSFKYAFLVKKNGLPSSKVAGADAPGLVHDRLLVRMPIEEEVKAAMSTNASIALRAHKKASKIPTNCFSNADERQRLANFGLRVRTTSPDKIQISAVNENGAEVELAHVGAPFHHMPSFEILRAFSVTSPPKQANEVNEVLSELIAKQQELSGLEGSLEGKLRSLLTDVVHERREYESPATAMERSDEKRILLENEKILQRRKEMDLAWQKQLEQDMDAVCDICNDGEVTPDNQILFCEACNVAIHQICYGIEEVPAGDYYCVACRFFKREKMSDVIARMKRDPNAPKFAPSPLPICCELCPRKQGAFIRTDTSNQRPRFGAPAVVLPKWVHVVCAKWQGLHFVEKGKPEVVEDVTELKMNFRRLDISCALCLGERGAFNLCRFEGCKNSLHVTCARASGLCEVIHGENAKGPVPENPWSLLCPEHSNVSPDEIPKDAVSVDQLIRLAKELPPEPKPGPPPRKPKPFHKLSGKERAEFLADPEYEKDLFVELLAKRLQGVHCEVCDVCEEDGKRLKRCECGIVFCDSCSLLNIDGVDESRNFTCFACRCTAEKAREGEAYKLPRCYLCSQKGGWLREAFAAPINKVSYYKNNPKEFAKTLFKQQLWCHSICVFWQYPKLSLNPFTGKVDLSDVIMTHGKGFIFSSSRCGLCGGKGGLKAKCVHEGCRGWGEKQKPYQFHVTCAREAGLEVDCSEQDHELFFYVKCYRHCGNAFNLRARLEDLIEIEKKRSGKKLEKYSALPMSYAHGSRLLNGAIWVLKTLGWAWRWAEWWVSYGSSWEPLLDENQNEENMTKEELRIVDSTPESRCEEARLCRLAALGAALRNRVYDDGDGFDNESLHRALRSMLHARSLVGPLEEFEIEFFVEWLGRAYRSKSRLLGFGDDKIATVADYFCVHQENKSPKFELGERPIPGKEVLPEGTFFETPKNDVDDFLKPERLEDGTIVQTTDKGTAKKPAPAKKQKTVVSVLTKAQDPVVDGMVPKEPARIDRVRRSIERRKSYKDSTNEEETLLVNEEQQSVGDKTDLGRNIDVPIQSFSANQPPESETSMRHREEDQSLLDAFCDNEKVTHSPAKRPKRFRRSVLGGNVIGDFYYGDDFDFTEPSPSSKSSARKAHVSESDANAVQFTPEETDLPLSQLLGSSKRKGSRRRGKSLPKASSKANDAWKETERHSTEVVSLQQGEATTECIDNVERIPNPSDTVVGQVDECFRDQAAVVPKSTSNENFVTTQLEAYFSALTVSPPTVNTPYVTNQADSFRGHATAQSHTIESVATNQVQDYFPVYHVPAQVTANEVINQSEDYLRAHAIALASLSGIVVVNQPERNFLGYATAHTDWNNIQIPGPNPGEHGFVGVAALQPEAIAPSFSASLDNMPSEHDQRQGTMNSPLSVQDDSPPPSPVHI